jgi:hypothetical protein
MRWRALCRAGVVGCAVLPAVPDDVQPGAGEDASGVRVVVAACDGIVVQLGCPQAGVAGVAGEVADGVAELLADGPAEVGVGGLAGLAGGGGDSGQADQRFGGGEPGPVVTGPGGQPCGPDGAPSS